MSETPPTARELLGNLYAATESADEARVLAARVEAVLALHSEFNVYDADDPADYSDATYLYTCCRECHTSDGEVTEWSDEGEWPCPTMRVLNGGQP